GRDRHPGVPGRVVTTPCQIVAGWGVAIPDDHDVARPERGMSNPRLRDTGGRGRLPCVADRVVEPARREVPGRDFIHRAAPHDHAAPGPDGAVIFATLRGV